MMDNINIVYNIDRNFVQHCAASLNSILLSYKGEQKLTFFIVHNDLTTEDISKLKTLENENCEIQFILIDGKLLKDLPIGENTVSNEITLSTYFRLFLPILLPMSVDKVIYLDADTITVKSIDLLWNESLGNYALGGVPDKESNQVYNKIRLGISGDYKYINAGVLLMNIAFLRDIHFVDLALQYINKNKDSIVYHDQDVVNALLYDKVKVISYQWDMMDCYLYKYPICNPKKKNEVLKYQTSPGILHFAGYFKPWNKECRNPYRELYTKALERTIWEGFVKKRKLQKPLEIIKYHVKSYLKANPYFK